MGSIHSRARQNVQNRKGQCVMDVDSLLKITQLGASGILLVILLQLWAEFRVQNEFIRKMLIDAAQDRAALKAAIASKQQ
jgi:hypothetical protein